MIRAITQAEAAIVEWLLTNSSKEGAVRPGPDIASLPVVGTCGCGCGSLDFDAEPFEGATIVADALAVEEGEADLDLILWGREGRITALELTPHEPTRSRAFPLVNQLRSYAQRGREIARSRRT